MPILPADQQLALGLTPPAPGQEEKDPKTKLKKIPKTRALGARPRLTLNDEQKAEVKKVLGQCWDEWDANTSLLKSKLRRYNDLMEGIKDPKSFPWFNCSNLHIPLIEIHITILHSVASQTMLENDPIFYVKVLQDSVGDSVDSDVEQFLHWTCKVNMKIDNDLSDIFWNTYRDGTGIGDLDWVEEYEKFYDVLRFNKPDDFLQQFPSPEAAGVSIKEYEALLQEIHDIGEAQFVPVKVEEIRVKYRGPRLRVVELKDFVVIPTTSRDTEYAMFVGDVFLERADYFRRMVRDDWFDREEVEPMLRQSGLNAAPDSISQAQDRIEGVARVRVTKADEYYCLQGVLRINLSGDEMEPEKKYLVVYEKNTKALLRVEEYPYFHNRCKYITWRFKRRSGRLLGQSLPDQLIDINEEIDTQHNQRIDSRTITTVPSFLKRTGTDWDPTRKSQQFYPGVTFDTSSIDKPDIKQMPITQTDMGQSLQEEQNLMGLADTRTGASQLRGGPQNARDPRAPAKKVAIQLQQSGIRADDHMRELRIGTSELGNQILELYFQYAPDVITYSRKDPATQAFVKAQVMRSKLRGRGMYLDVARTSIMDNPSAVLQKELTMYELMMRNPLVAQNIFRIREVTHRLVKAMRERDADKIVPPLEQLIKELQQQQGLSQPGQPDTVRAMGMSLMNGGGGSPGPNHGARNGQGPSRPQGGVAPVE